MNLTHNHKRNPYQSAAHLLKTIAHPARLAILDILLANDEACVCHMEAILNQRQAYLSQHLMALREAGVVTDRRDGRNIYYHISSPTVLQLVSTIKDMNGLQLEAIRMVPDTCTCPKCSQKQVLVEDLD